MRCYGSVKVVVVSYWDVEEAHLLAKVDCASIGAKNGSQGLVAKKWIAGL